MSSRKTAEWRNSLLFRLMVLYTAAFTVISAAGFAIFYHSVYSLSIKRMDREMLDEVRKFSVLAAEVSAVLQVILRRTEQVGTSRHEPGHSVGQSLQHDTPGRPRGVRIVRCEWWDRLEQIVGQTPSRGASQLIRPLRVHPRPLLKGPLPLIVFFPENRPAGCEVISNGRCNVKRLVGQT